MNIDPPTPNEKKDMVRAVHQKRMAEFKDIPYMDAETRSFDGLLLKGKFYPSKTSKDTVIIFHGYRSSTDSDSTLIAKHCIERGFNVLCVHQRAHGESEGKTITFGVCERLDCKSWVDYTVSLLSSDTHIMLMGVSMGASTVMMASSLNMPSVRGIFADCGYSSPREILRSTIKKLSYPVGPAYSLVRTSAKLIGGFDPDSISATDALSNSTVPITIVHGEADNFVPCHMAKKCYEAAKTPDKRLVLIPEGIHAYSYYYDTSLYLSALDEMLDKIKD